MGTKIYHESYLPGYQYHSMRKTNEISANSKWPLFFGNKIIQNGQHGNGNLPGTVTNLFSGYETEALKQMMLTQEAAFKHQVSELHRLYKVQKEIMNKIKRTEPYKRRIPIDTPPSSSSLVHRMPYEDSQRRWHKSPLQIVDSNDCEVLDSRPLKARKCLFDIHLTADNYIDLEEETTVPENKIIGILSNSCTRDDKVDLGIATTLDSKVQFFDLNEPFQDDDVDATSSSSTGLLHKSNNARERMFNSNGTGRTEPHLDFVSAVPHDESPIHTQLVYSQSPEVGQNIFRQEWNLHSTLVSDPSIEKRLSIIKANGSCNNEGINTSGDTNSSHITHNPGNAYDGTFSHNKIPDFPTQDNPCIPNIKNKIGLIDINLLYEVDAEVAEGENDKRAADVGGGCIDLNLCANEDELTFVPSCDSTVLDAKLDTDLEVPVLADSEEETSSLHKDKHPRDEADISAAMSIVAISSFLNIDWFEEKTCDPTEGSLEDPLLWFSKIASSSHPETLETPENAFKNVLREMDDFEAMTLSLTELKEEEYMPTPLVYADMELETETNPLTSRGTRRGRKKRDFQKDILPAITSLSRHEVAEDVHTFGRIMKEMGHSLAKKTGGSRRGRPRLFADVEPLTEPKVTYKPLMKKKNSGEIGLDGRVLTGWGEIPRRPRRRRCHVGNLSSITLS